MGERSLTDAQIEQAIDAWHQGDSTEKLHEYLGWTWDEYKRWVETGEKP